MQHITICGNSGSGKSTFAQSLSKVTGLPVFHLDLIQFQPGWQKTPLPEFKQKHAAWLAEPLWIIEGVGPWQPLKKRFQAADTIIYLDFPVDFCLEMAQNRMEQDLLLPNQFLPENCRYAEKVKKQETVIRFFHREWRPKILALMDSLRENRNLFVITQPESLGDFLAEFNYPYPDQT